MNRRSLMILSGGTLALPFLASNASAQRTPIQMVIPFVAGGPTDLIGRLFAEAMSRSLDTPIVIENIVGAGGTTAAGRVSQSRPDGNTIMMAHIGMSTAPTLFRRLTYDPVNGFETVGLVADVPMTLVGRRGLPANNLQELLTLVRRERDNITLANAGVGAASHLCGLLFMSAANAPLTTVPFRGTAPAMQELINGRVDLLCDQTSQTAEVIRNGTVKPFAVTANQRIPQLPNIPTGAEGGLSALEVVVWHGLYVARGTPRPAVDRLSAALRAALRDPSVLSQLNEMGARPVAQDQATPEAHRAFWEADIAKWAPIIRAAGQFAD